VTPVAVVKGPGQQEVVKSISSSSKNLSKNAEKSPPKLKCILSI